MVSEPHTAESLSLLFALSSRESSRGAVCDAVGCGTISVTALTCGQDTDRAHTPGCRLSPLRCVGYAATVAPAVDDAKVRSITPQRKQNATEATRQRDDRNAPAAARGERVRPRARSAAPSALRPRQITQLACTSKRPQLARARLRDVPFVPALGRAVFRRHQPEKRTGPRRIAAKARRRIEHGVKRQARRRARRRGPSSTAARPDRPPPAPRRPRPPRAS